MTLELHKLKLPVLEVHPATAPVFVVLYAYGSFCPVHRGHVELLHLAREHCASAANTHVICSVMAPSPSTKLQLKNGADAISDDHRHTMLRLALREHEGIVLLINETKEQLRARLTAHLTAHYKQTVQLMMPSVCGPENLLAIKSKRIYREGVICVHSRALPINVRAMLDKHPYKHCIQYVVREDSVDQPRSSTLIRNALREFYQGTLGRQELQIQLEQWMAPQVIEYVLEHHLWA